MLFVIFSSAMTANDIRHILEEKFNGARIEVQDDGDKHKHHKQAKEHGGGHFSVRVISDDFASLNTIERHQRIYQALGMPRDEIHALSVLAKTPEEHKK